MNDDTVSGQIWRHGAPVDGFSLDVVSDCLDDDDTMVWADLQNPSEEMLHRLAQELELNRWAVEDAIADSERVKAAGYAHHTFVTVYAVSIANAPSPEGMRGSSVRVQRISIFLKHNGLITVRLTEGVEDVFDFNDVRARWDESGVAEQGVGALLHGLLDVVVDGHFDAVQELDDDIEDLEGMLFDDRAASRTLQRSTYAVRKDLVALRRVVLPMREVVAVIQRRRDSLGASDHLEPEFTDLYDHVLRVTEWTESLRDMVTTVFETNLSLQDARLNTVMKKLTGWAAIVAVPTAITGFYGQNVPFPGFDHTVGFVSSCVLLATAMAVLYALFKKRDWL